MRRIGTENGLFSAGNPAVNTKGTPVSYWWLNAVQEELANIIEGFDLTLNEADPAQVLSILQKFVPPGALMYFAQATAPAGWLPANGAAISRSAYARLFTAIGTTWGAGDGATTFNLPDARGEFLRGLDSGRGVDSGRAIGSFQQGTHITGDNGSDPCVQGIGVLANCFVDPPDGTSRPVYYSTSATILNDATVYWGRVRPRNIAMLACIKY